jgi:hypothetical protein
MAELNEMEFSSTTRLRLAEARRRAGLDLDHRLGVVARDAPATLRELRDALDCDLAATVRRLQSLFNALPEKGIPSPGAFFRFDRNDLTFGAFADFGGVGGPILSISAGAVLGMEELLLKCLTNADFFMFEELRGAGEFDSAAPFALLRVVDDRPPRYFDYHWLEGLGDDLGDALVTPLPYTPWRLLQFELLRDLAIEWIYLHEASHWIAGHLHFLSAGRRTPAKAGTSAARLAMSEGRVSKDRHPEREVIKSALEAANAGDVAPEVAHRCMEHQADYTAFTLLARLHHHQRHPDNAFARYQRGMRALHLPNGFKEIASLDHGQRLRSMLVAAEAAVLIIERSSRVEVRNIGYPSADIAGIMGDNFLRVAVATW